MNKDIDPGINRPVSRRDFLKIAGAAALGALAPDLPFSHSDRSLGTSRVTEAAPAVGHEQQSVRQTWALTEVNQEWLRANPQDVRYISDITNSNKEVTHQFVLMGDGRVMSTYYDQARKQFVEFAPISSHKMPIGYPRCLSVAENGIMLAGGVSQDRSINTMLAISYDLGASWVPVNWPFGSLGAVHKILPVDPVTNKYLVSLQHYDRGTTSMFLATVDPQNRMVNLQETDIKGAARDLSILSFDASSNKMGMVASGTDLGKNGLLFYTVDLSTGKGTVEEVFPQAGNLFGRAEYRDENGDLHFVSSNADRRIIYDFNITRRTIAQEIPYADILDDKGLRDYMPKATMIWAVETFVDHKDNKRKIAFGGLRPSASDGVGRAVVGVFTMGTRPKDTVKFVDVDPQKQAGVWEQKDFVLKKTPDGNLIMDVILGGELMGKIIYDLATDVVRSDKGLDDVTSVRLVSLANRSRAFLPKVNKKAA